MNCNAELLRIAIGPKTKADQGRFAQGLSRLRAKEPHLEVYIDQQRGLAIIDGIGEREDDILMFYFLGRSELRLEWLECAFDIPLTITSETACKEAFTCDADGDGRYVDTTGESREYAHVKIHLYRAETGTGYVFHDRSIGGVIPKKFIDPIRDGIKEALVHGVLAGFRVDDVRIELYDGSYHDVDSSETAFKIAGALAFQDAARNAQPVVLEPMMRVDISVRTDYVNDIKDDIAIRRGQFLSLEQRDGTPFILARMPLSEMFGYDSDLKSRTQGRAHCSALWFDGYDALRSGSDGASEGGPGVRVPRPVAPKADASGIQLPEP